MIKEGSRVTERYIGKQQYGKMFRIKKSADIISGRYNLNYDPGNILKGKR